MKCAVIGSSGFIGKEIVKYLLSKGDEVVCFDRVPAETTEFVAEHRFLDITERQKCFDELKGFEEVYNIAGVLGTSELNETVDTAIKVNVLGAVNVFDACIKNGVKRVFYPSKPNVWLNTYTITKEASEKFTELYNEKFDTKFIRLRWFNAYGPSQHTHPVRKIGPTFSLLAKHNLPINIFGSGDNVVDMIYSKDIAKWSVEATRHNLWKKVYDLGRGVPVTVNEFANEINRIAGSSGGVTHTNMRDGETENTYLVADISELVEEFKKVGVDVCFSDWDETLKETYEFYKNYSDEESKSILQFHKIWQD